MSLRRGISEGAGITHSHAFVGFVVQVDVGDVDLVGQRGCIDAEVVVLAGDLHRPGRQSAHRMVGTVVAEGQLVGGGTERTGEQLMTEADAEHRHSPLEQRRDVGGSRGHHLRVARTVAEEHSVGRHGEHLSRGSRGGHHAHGGDLGEAGQDHRLDAEVVGDHVESPGSHLVRRRRRDQRDEIDTRGSGFAPCGVEQYRGVGGTEGSGHRAGVTQDSREATSVDAGDTWHAPRLQAGVERGLGTPVAVTASEFTNHHSTGKGVTRFVVERRDAVIADVRLGEGHDLARIRRIRHDLLVSGDGGVEHHLPRSHPAVGYGPEDLSFEDVTVGEDQSALDDSTHASSPFSTVRRPRYDT
jgi:hypothetical protein